MPSIDRSANLLIKNTWGGVYLHSVEHTGSVQECLDSSRPTSLTEILQAIPTCSRTQPSQLFSGTAGFEANVGGYIHVEIGDSYSYM